MKFVCKYFFLLLTLCLTSTFAFSAPASVKKISTESTENNFLIKIDLSQSIKYHYFYLTNPKRLVVDLDNTKPIAVSLPSLSDAPWIKQFRVAPHTAEQQRLVLELQGAAKANLALAPATGVSDWRLIIDLQHATPTPINPSKATSTPKKTEAEVKSFATGSALAPQQVRPIKTANTHQANTRCINVVIDPGHGGSDPGAIGLHGTKEKNVTLAISQYLNDLINQTPGMCAYMTRNADYFVSLRGRIDIARKKSADLFIAIHADMFQNTTARGATVFALSQRGATSEAARWIAHNENVSDFLDIGETADKDKDLQSILMDISQNETINRSLILGKYVLLQLDDVSKLHHTIVEQAGFVVLKSPDIPSILVETGFLSNKDEEAQLTQSTYQKKIALAIYRGVMKYSQQYSSNTKAKR